MTGANNQLRDTLLALGLFVIVMGGLAAVAMSTGWEDSLASLSSLTAAQMGLLLFLSLWNYGLRGVRWHLSARTAGLSVGIWQSLRHYIAGLAMTVTPARIGEVVRLRWLWLETGAPVERTAPLMIIDRAFDLAAVSLLMAISLATGAAAMTGGIAGAVIAITFAFLATRPVLFRLGVTILWKLVGRWPRFFVKARRASKVLAPFSRPGILIAGITLGALGWFAEGIAFHLLLVWFGADIGLPAALGIFVLSMLTGGATGMPGGVGGAEAAMVGLLSLQGVPLEISIPATAVIRLTTLWFAILLGLAVLPLAERAAVRGQHALENH